MMEFFNTAVQFLKLEKVEIGGIRGKALTSNINKVHEEFKDLYGVFSLRTYDSLDPKDPGFLKDYEKFNQKVSALDRKLGAILARAFDDCIVTESLFKLLHIFGTLVERKLIAFELTDRMPKLVIMLNSEMDESQEIFARQEKRLHELGKALTDRNMPPVSGQLSFSKELRHKIVTSVKSFREINHPITESEGAVTIMQKYNELMEALDKYEDNVYNTWATAAEKKTLEGLNRPLLVRNSKTRALKVNFGQETLGILVEVKHLRKDFPERPVPQKAGEIFRRFEELRKYNNSLEQMVTLYNYLKFNCADVEHKLIADEVAEIDESLESAEHTLTWNTQHIWHYIDGLRKKVSKLKTRVQKSQANVVKIEELINKWREIPLFERIKEPGKEPLLNLDDREAKKTERYNEINESVAKIQELVEENEKLFLVGVSVEKNNRKWKNYLKFLDEIVAKGLIETIASSIGYLLFETEVNNDITPLFDAKLELFDPDIIFRPSLDKTIQNNFYDLITGIVDDILHMATLVPRIAQESKGSTTYLGVINNHEELSSLKKTLMSRVDLVIEQANKDKEAYSEYSYLWTESRQDYLFYFLNFARQLTEEEIVLFEEDERSIKKVAPILGQFKEQIDHYEAIHTEAMTIGGIKTFEKWFRADIRPFKRTLLNTIKRWSWAFKKHLLDHIINSLNELDEFIKTANEGLSIEVSEGDYDNLIKVMEFLQMVKDKQTSYDEMFEPLKDVIAVISLYEVDIPENTLLQLQELPEKWACTKRLSVTAKQAAAPLQGQEVGKLKARIEEYDMKQKEARAKYQQMRFYSYNCKSPYEHLSSANAEIEVLEVHVKELQSEASLFEVTVPDFPLIEQCRIENKLLKQLWDYTFLVRTSIEEWKTTPWKDIDVENMDMECKKFAKDVRGLDKAMRSWHVYLGLETTVKNMLTSLRAVGELQNSAIRDRHWDQLVEATKVRFTMSDETTLADLLCLNLHNFEDEVHNIVDKACKEMAMEKMLTDLENNWRNMEFDYEVHESGYKLLRASEELVETLEENQVQTQNMMTSKYIAFFLTEMSKWQKTLGMVDTVIARWMEVQRAWAHLQSIFLGSEDIRIQLPQDTERFDGIDKEFKELMTEMARTPNVVRATNVESLPDQLSDLYDRLILCEKALSEYLETKRLAFPRFYFASSADLLDILSNGHDPQKVSKHLTKLFDSMAKLKMIEKDGKTTKTAHSMVAKDGEVVKFLEDCSCDGQVESWLNRLMSSMRATIRNEFAKSMVTYEDTPREKWLLLYPAQVALAGTQICWTTEVSTAFAKLEEGYENALKDYYKKQITQLNALIFLLLGNLDKGGRQKVMTICTIDVHSRDTVGKMITQKIESNLSFNWQSQLRHRWDK